MTGALYIGRVHHARFSPQRHTLAYRVFMVLLDLDEERRRSWAFARNRPALISFQDRDHGDGSDRPLRTQISSLIALHGYAAPAGKIQVLCLPRVLGHGFNPLSVYYCHDLDGRLAVVVYEVNNTFGGRHFYVLPAGPSTGHVRQHCDKAFFVSPFMELDLAYDFLLAPPAEQALIAIRVSGAGETVLTASFLGERRPLSDAAIVAAWVSHPLQTVGVLAGIYLEGIKLLLKGFSWRSPKSANAAECAPEL
jgi:uncharacterized protein